MDLNKLSIVFIDDELLLTDLFAEYVKDAYPLWKLDCFTDEISALNYLRDNADGVDVVICDIGMPYISGIEILEIVRKKHPKIRRIVFSGQLDSRSLLGANKFAEMSLCKPIRAMELCGRIIEFMSSSRETI